MAPSAATTRAPCMTMRAATTNPPGGSINDQANSSAEFRPRRKACTVPTCGASALQLPTRHGAGGRLAPHCESEVAEPVISRLGLRSLDLWREALPDTPFNGSLVVALARERNDFERFARMTSGYERLDADGLAALEPS